jgi:hypothetical protein
MSSVLESLQPHRHRRAVQRPLLVFEQLLHQPRFGAGEDVGGDLALVLDVAADQAVEVGDLVDVLELVQGDEGAVAAAFLEPKRQVEQRVQRRQRIALRVELQLGADPVGAQRQADARLLQEVLELGAQRAL